MLLSGVIINMTTDKTYQFRLQLSKEQETFIHKSFDCTLKKKYSLEIIVRLKKLIISSKRDILIMEESI